MADDPKKKKSGPKKKARDEFSGDEIFKAPVITRDPVSRQAKLGGKVVLRVTAEGKPLPSFQWYHNGKKVSGANTDRLTLNRLRRASAGAYHCEAKNFVGKATSRVAMLSFFTARVPKLVIGPETLKIDDGKPFTLKVTSPPAAELKDFKIYWIFNGMRIKGAHGPELSISAAKKKYEGEYKAMIATGGSLETSNIAKVIVRAPKARKTAEAEAPPELPQEPAREPEPSAAPQASAARWEDFLFNPEAEEDGGGNESSLVAPAPGSDDFGHTSPGTPGSPQAPLSNLPTQDLIREVAAQSGASSILHEAIEEDPSGLLLAPAPAEPESEDPSCLIERLEKRAATPPPPPVSLAAPRPAPNPGLARKREFLEKLLGKFQAQHGKRARAA